MGSDLAETPMAKQRHVAGLSLPAARMGRHALAPDRGGADADSV
jgi:hypothetical protein